MQPREPSRWRWLLAEGEPNGLLAALQALQSPSECAQQPPASRTHELPRALRLVLLTMELALASGAAFLLLSGAGLLGALLRRLLGEAAGLAAETAAFFVGLLSFLGRFFGRPPHLLARRLTRCSLRGAGGVAQALLLHAAGLTVLRLAPTCPPQTRTAPLSGGELLQRLLLIPAREELLFRGALLLVAHNRLRGPHAAAVASLLFAASHLANARRAHVSAGGLALQCVWALLVGGFLSLRLLATGSLAEGVALHVVNNAFARAVSAEPTEPLVLGVGLAAAAMYVAAIARLLQPEAKPQRDGKHKGV